MPGKDGLISWHRRRLMVGKTDEKTFPFVCPKRAKFISPFSSVSAHCIRLAHGLISRIK
ncbi:hypothetical protein BN1183_AC_01640 [Pantoea ananatis]|nr:hypothetical protein BN1183_AC_01640 [Pantoea ananatis]